MKSFIKRLLVILVLLSESCSGYLDVKPDKKLTVPSKISDLMALMQEVQTMNYDYPSGIGEIGSDNVFLPFETWTAISSIENRSIYVWEKQPVNEGYWSIAYRRILHCNTVIDLIGDVRQDKYADKQALLGAALFFRGYSFYDLVQVFSPAFDDATADTDKGIVLRLDADVNPLSKRASVRKSYEQAIKDLQSAISLLPERPQQYPTQPSKAAAYAALARCYLSMQRYDEAGRYADSSLLLHSTILDYNDVAHVPYPFERFNEEVVFYAQLSGRGVLNESRTRVDTNLYKSYVDDDLRKKLFFLKTNDGYHSFVGSYSQTSTVAKFCGITSAEMILTRAEVAARKGEMDKALYDINRFMENRYDSNGFDEVTEVDQAKLLTLILEERRKELLQRGIRWQDIRRLADETDHSVRLERNLGGTAYSISPEQVRRFAYDLPQVVIDRTNLE